MNTRLWPRPGTAQQTWTGPGQPVSRLGHRLPLVAKHQNTRLGTLPLGLALMVPFTPRVRLRGLCVWRLHQWLARIWGGECLAHPESYRYVEDPKLRGDSC